MNIVALNGAFPVFQLKMVQVNKLICDVLQELDVEVKGFNLTSNPEPQELQTILESVKDTAGIILSTTVTSCSVGASMMHFFEHLSLNPQAAQLFARKNCMLVILTADGGGLQALNFYSQAINYLGAFDPIKICLDTSHFVEGDELAEGAREIVEKQIEDYYRMVRQGRQFLIPVESDKTKLLRSGVGANNQASKLYQKLNLDHFTERQEKDIDEIKQFLSKKYAEKLEPKQEPASEPPVQTDFILPELTPTEEFLPPAATIPTFTPTNTPTNVVTKPDTCHQRTQALPSYFQRASGGANHTMQLSISGPLESFEGYLVIEGVDCKYYEGKADHPEITIIADEDVWDNVLLGKVTAQKAFMIGQLKVRGNFVLLTKFETMFSPVV